MLQPQRLCTYENILYSPWPPCMFKYLQKNYLVLTPALIESPRAQTGFLAL